MLLKLSKFFLYASLFSVLIVLKDTFFPFIGGKYYFFRVATELALIFFILWWGFRSKPEEFFLKIKKVFERPIVIAVSLFVFAYLLASIFAYDPKAAFWSNYERGEGGFQMLHYYVFFLLLALLFDRESDWIFGFKLALVAATLLVAYGIFGNFGYEGFVSPYQGTLPPTFWEKLTQARFYGSLGNPAYIAPYLMFSIFYALYLFFRKNKKGEWSRLLFYALTVLFFFFFALLSQTRGAFLGIVAAVSSFFLYLILLNPQFRKKALAGLLVFVVMVALLVKFNDRPFVKSIPGSRVLHLSFKEKTVQTRLWTWNSAWQGFKERPIFGWGPENFSVVFDKYFDPRHFNPNRDTETWFDRAHSVIFDYLAETGMLGLLSYLGIFAVFICEFIRKNKPQPASPFFYDKPALKGLMLAIIIGYLVQGLAIFDVLPMYLNLFFFLAFASYKFAPMPEAEFSQNKFKN